MASDLPSIGVTLMDTDRMMPPAELAREIEARGLESLFLAEHSHIPASRKTVWPGSPPGENIPLPDTYWHINDQIVALSMAAAVTEKIELGTSVTLVPQHDPIWLAKQIATLDHLSGGRVVLGVGFGWNEEQTASHGVEFKTRRARTEEAIGVMRALWTQEEASFDGEFFTLEPSWAYPKPRRAIPIIMGGGWGPVLFDAITRYGDGWMPITARPTIADRVQPLRDRFEAAGRDPASVQIAITGAVEDPDGIITLGREGVQRVLLTVWSEERDEILATLDRFAAIAEQARGKA